MGSNIKFMLYTDLISMQLLNKIIPKAIKIADSKKFYFPNVLLTGYYSECSTSASAHREVQSLSLLKLTAWSVAVKKRHCHYIRPAASRRRRLQIMQIERVVFHFFPLARSTALPIMKDRNVPPSPLNTNKADCG